MHNVSVELTVFSVLPEDNRVRSMQVEEESEWLGNIS